MNERSSPRVLPAPAGFALPVTILAMVVIGALVTGGFFAATQEERISVSTRAGTDALFVAEQGIHQVLGSWTTSDYTAIAVGSTGSASGTVADGAGGTTGQYAVIVRRVTDRLFFLESTGTVLRAGTASSATRRLAMLARLRNFDIDSDRAMQIYGGLNVGGAAKVSGDDVSPWTDGCTDTGVKAGVVAKDTSKVVAQKPTSIEGNPQKVQDASLGSDDFFVYGDFTYAELVSLATKRFADDETVSDTDPVLDANGKCDTAPRTNWGAPEQSSHACHKYFPIIHFAGDAKIQSNDAGQGILLVDGDLHIAGGYAFYGIVVVKGKFTTGNGNADIRGTMLVYSDGNLGAESDITGTPIVSLSSCAIDRASKLNDAFSRAYPVAERSWVDLSTLTAES